MGAIMLWVFGLMGSIALLVVMAGAKSYLPHLALCLIVAVLVTIAAYRKNQLELSRRVLSPSKLASINAGYMTMLWAWGGLGIAATYLLLPELHELNWWRKEWWQFVLGFGGAAVMSGVFAYKLSNDESDKGSETTLVRYSRYLAIGQLVGTIATMIGLIVDGKMDFGWIDWSANNFFFAGAAGLAALSWIAISTQKAMAKT